MPSVSSVLAEADRAQAALDADKATAAEVRSSMPQPQTRENESTVVEGWLHVYRSQFHMDGSSDTSSVKGQLSARLKPWAKRYFVLSDNGTGQAKLYCYKSPEDAKVAKVPIDMNLCSAVNALNGPLELELSIGERTLRLKALETADRDRWMLALQTYVLCHTEQHKAAVELNRRRYRKPSAALGIRDLDGAAAAAGLRGGGGGGGGATSHSRAVVRRRWWRRCGGGGGGVGAAGTIPRGDGDVDGHHPECDHQLARVRRSHAAHVVGRVGLVRMGSNPAYRRQRAVRRLRRAAPRMGLDQPRRGHLPQLQWCTPADGRAHL